MIADIIPILFSSLLTALQVPLLLVAGLLGLIASVILVPVVIHVDAGRGAAPEATPDISALVAPWLGALGLELRQRTDGWEARVLLLGRISLYRRLLLTYTSSKQEATSSRELPAPSVSKTTATPPVTQQAPAPIPPASISPISSRDNTKTKGLPPPENLDTDKKGSFPSKTGMLTRASKIWTDIHPFLPPTGRLLTRLLRIVGLRHLQVDATVALGDAAATGKLVGQIQAVVPFLPTWARVDIGADFVRPVSHGQASVRLHLYLARLLASIGRFAVSAGYLWLRRWWRLRQTARTLSAVTD